MNITLRFEAVKTTTGVTCWSEESVPTGTKFADVEPKLRSIHDTCGWRLTGRHDFRWGSYAWPGGYEIHYLTADGGILCHHCANENIELTSKPDAEPDWRIVACSLHEEGEPLQCDHCGRDIVSDYGVPD